MNLNEILEIEYPIIQGGMARIATGEFAAAVSNNGAMGLIASGGMPIEDIRTEIIKAKNLTDKPFGLNVLLLHKKIDKLAELVLEYDIKFVTTGAGNPGKYMKMRKDNGVKVFPVVSNKALAIRMERAGADGVICEGSEAGGHIGELSTMVLTNEVKRAIDIPVVSAGGIAYGNQMLAAEALGASGVQLGTILLSSKECPIHPNYKEKLIKSRSNMVKVIGRINGLPIRVLRNEMVNDYIKAEKNGASVEELEMMTHAALGRAVRDGDMIKGSIMCGQVVDAITQIRELKEIFETLMQEYEESKSKLCNS